MRRLDEIFDLREFEFDGGYKSRQDDCESVHWIVNKIPNWITLPAVKVWYEEKVCSAYAQDDVQEDGMVDELVNLTRRFGFKRVAHLSVVFLRSSIPFIADDIS